MPDAEVLGQISLGEFRLATVGKPFDLEGAVVGFSVAENQAGRSKRSIGAFELFTEGAAAEIEFGFKSSLAELLGDFQGLTFRFFTA